MQKVEGSNPFSRLPTSPCTWGFSQRRGFLDPPSFRPLSYEQSRLVPPQSEAWREFCLNAERYVAERLGRTLVSAPLPSFSTVRMRLDRADALRDALHFFYAQDQHLSR
jgi:hypothetical protein